MNSTELLDYMRAVTYRPLTAEELVAALQIKQHKDFRQLLQELELQGSVILTRKGKYGLPEKMGLVVGRLQGHQRGFGFVLPDRQDLNDVFISADNLNGAMHGDRVVVRVSSRVQAGNRMEGEVIRVLTRGQQTLVGTLEINERIGFVMPDEQRVTQDIFIPREEMNGARHGDKVVVAITRWPEKRRNPEGRVLEVLGQRGDPGVDILAIIRKFGLPEEFPQGALLEAEQITLGMDAGELQSRQDLRSWLTVTIDGEDAKDLDDAVSLDVLPEGSYRLGVHIADVSYYVPQGSQLDQEAWRRGTSVYLVDRVIPMLPPRLSNDICSLNAGDDRLAISVVLDLDRQGKVKNYQIFPSVINIDRRLTYTQVRLALDGDAEQQQLLAIEFPMLDVMGQLSQKLRQYRAQRGAVDFEFPEIKVIVDEKGAPIELKQIQRSQAEQLIEEFMLLANETVAKHLQQHQIPGIYRVHNQPAAASLSDLNAFLHRFGYHLRTEEGQTTPREYQDVLDRVKGQPEERLISTVLLRSMQHAGYSATCAGHFAMAVHDYCHFTSPIRRYPDLMVHRMLREGYFNGRLSSDQRASLQDNLAQAAEHSSVRERAAEEAERDVLDLKKVEFMLRYLGQRLKGLIVGVMPFGFFVEMETGAEGLVHVSSLTDDYYQYQETNMALQGQHTKKLYTIGTAVEVLVARVDPTARKIDLELVETVSH